MKTPTAGDRVGRYRLVSLLGRGGMGEVHLADDESLGRKVAIKFLSETLRGDERARRRFAREARSAAALDHPYICKVYDEGEHRGVPYIAMEYVEGTTLRERIDQQGLPVAEALRIAVDITDALAYAHDRGIVHRDLKPSNIFLTPHGHVKILDFGLARRLPEFVGIAPGQEQPSTSDLTTEGCAAGTVPYMAPEQLRGQPATALSDIFSIGVLLYEMLTGIHPFRRETSFETAHAILHDTPAPPAAPSPDIPAEVWQCLERVLDKAPRNRPSSCHDLRAELRSLLHSSESTAVSIRVQPRGAGHRRFRFAALALAVALAAIGFAAVIRTVRKDTGPAPVAAEPAAVETSIAVLPLTNLSADPDFEYFCDGMTDEIISGLTRISGLRVTARTSAFAFRDSHQDAREIGRQLRVAYLVSGSVRRAGHRLRVAVTLVDTASGFNLWSQEYEERLTDVLDVQNRISRAIVGALPVKEPSSDVNLWSPPPTMDGDAYVLYLKGLHLLNQRTGPALQASIRLFGQAVDRDPRFALAYVGIADAYSLSEYYARLTPSEAARRSGAAIERALAIDPNLAEARAARAALLEKRWDWSGALGEYEHALRAKPGDARTRCWYAALLAQLGRNAEAERETERSVQLDPLSPYAHVVSGLVAYLGRRNDEALAHADLALHIAPDYHLAHELRAYALVQAGQPERAVDAARSAREAGGPGRAEVAEAVACAAAGRRDEALAILRTLEAEWREGHGSPGRLAVICAGLGAVDEALEWLARARDEKDIWIAQLKADPVFDVLRGDPRFRRLLREVGLEVGA